MPYDSSEHVVNLVKELLFYHFDLGYQMQINLKRVRSREVQRAGRKCHQDSGLFHKELSGEHFVYEAPCRLNVPLCNRRRAAEGVATTPILWYWSLLQPKT